MKAYLLKTRWFYLVAAIIVILDQVTKELVRVLIPLGQTWSPWPWLAPYARIIHWTNTGVAFGMFQGKSLLFAVLAAVVIAAIIYYYPQVPVEDKVLRFALSMQLGGALGNFIDRVFQQGQVTDFVSVGNFAVFNVADACITVGVGVLLIGIWLEDKREKEQRKLLEKNEPSSIDANRSTLE
ncbi:MAG: signal peptidase II [Anaerolineaceae bacterium]